MVYKDRFIATFVSRLLTFVALIATLTLLRSAPAYSQTSVCVPWVEKIPSDYAAQQMKHNFSVVYSDCRYPHGKAVLVIPLTIFPSFPIPPPNVKKIPTTTTVTFDRQKEEWAGVAQILHFDRGCILNSASLDATPAGFRISDELMGGMPEQNRTAEVIAELLHSPLHYLPPDKVADAMRHHPTRACKTSEEGW